MIRRLLAIQKWLARAETRIWLIFEAAGFMQLDRIEGGGFMAMNPDLDDLFHENRP
jgi:hypothetical protein